MTTANDAAGTLPALLNELADRDVLHIRSLRHGTDRSALSRVGDRVWSLAEAQPDQHLESITLHWPTYPNLLEYDFKVFILATLDSPYPPALGRYTGIYQASISTVHLWFKRLRVFATWLRHRGIDRLYEVNDRDLDQYLDHVRSIQASTSTRRQLLNAARACVMS
ncbi:hypothetical protein ACTU45_30805 [Streptomyces sp. 24-1644]|uniref:hypothetical protein n=1 Tax=Streptomyces sp. 24-1644 TaxID=3457315 RepID=UPI003FA6D7F3